MLGKRTTRERMSASSRTEEESKGSHLKHSSSINESRATISKSKVK
jgi:hypothetical protein